jgi:hypothetical protein
MRLSDVLDLPVVTEQGQRIGHVFALRAVNDSDTTPGNWMGCALVVGRAGGADGGHGNLPVGGHRFSPLAVVGSPRPWPSVLPTILS